MCLLALSKIRAERSIYAAKLTSMKTDQGRIDAAIDYIRDMNKIELATHILSTVQSNGGSFSSIGKELSLGSRPDGSDDPKYATNTKKREALRALLLCQRVYLSKLWSETDWIALNRNWKTLSLAQWSNKSEQQIQDGIEAYTIGTSMAGKLADAAQVKPNKDVQHPALRARGSETNLARRRRL